MRKIIIRGEETVYSISPSGDIYNDKKKTSITLKDNSGGYKQVGLYTSKGRVTCLVHRLVAQAYLENPNNFPIVNHLDNNRANNHVSNLEWNTIQGNSDHMVKQGRSAKGSSNGNSILSEVQVKEVRKLHLLGVSKRSLARLLNVDRTVISAIIQKETWKHI
jgi:LEA14-like dessication related protein